MTATETDSGDDTAFTEETLRLAGLAYERVMSGVDPQLDTMPPELTPADAVRWIGDRVTELVAGFAELPLDRLVDLVPPTPLAGDQASEPAPRGEPVAVASPPGGLAEVRIWIHPIGELGDGVLRFRLTDLQPSTGDALPGGTAVFAPAEIDVPVGGASSVLLRYPIPPGAIPGPYNGLVLAGGAADAVVPITVQIRVTATTVETLEQYAELTRTAMAEAIAGGEPADYLYDLVRDYAARKGKGLRPGLLLAAADACGAATRTALPAAAALELLHTAFLIHDDVEDHSRLRRGLPTLHELHGAALAINAGDALANLAVRPLTSTAFPRYRSREVLTELRMAIRQTTEGQALELGWRRHAVVDLTPLDYLELVGRKTCWYTTMAPLRIGAQLGRWRPEPAALDRLGFLAGCAFQIRDDLLDLAPGGQAGKAPRSDIVEGKRTLMLIHLLGVAGPADRQWVVDYLSRAEDDRSSAEQDQLLALLTGAGSLAYAERFAAVLATAAQESLETAFAAVPPSSAVDFLRELIDYLVNRTS